MTPQEVKELVEQCGLNIEGNKHIECEKIVISALEKQIPKKPKKDEYGFLHCPCCDYDDYSLMHDSNFADRYNHCNHCGQALDWSDTE